MSKELTLEVPQSTGDPPAEETKGINRAGNTTKETVRNTEEREQVARWIYPLCTSHFAYSYEYQERVASPPVRVYPTIEIVLVSFEYLSQDFVASCLSCQACQDAG